MHIKELPLLIVALLCIAAGATPAKITNRRTGKPFTWKDRLFLSAIGAGILLLWYMRR